MGQHIPSFSGILGPGCGWLVTGTGSRKMPQPHCSTVSLVLAKHVWLLEKGQGGTRSSGLQQLLQG